MEICIYGMHMRVDGQHSVMTSLNSVALLCKRPADTSGDDGRRYV